MAANAGSVTKRMAALCFDVPGEWCTDNFALVYLNQVYEDCFNELNNINFPFDEVVDEFLNVAAGTKDMSAFQAVGGLLEFMVQPIQLEWKLAGAPATDYRDVERVDKLSDVSTLQSINGYDFRDMGIFLQPSTVAVDLRLRSQKLFSELTDIDKPLALNSIKNFLAYRGAALIQALREKKDQVIFLTSQGDQQLYLLEANFIKKNQSKTRRFGSVTRLRRQGQFRMPTLRSS